MDSEYYKKHEPIFNSWRIKRELGEGSFGKVFEIEREDFGRVYKAALKAITIPKNQSEVKNIMSDGMDEKSVTEYFRNFVEEIVNEFVLMSQLKGKSNIVSYEDHAVIEHTDGIGWDILIRMELLQPLNEYIKSVKLTRKEVIQLGIDMCTALELCQKYNIIHRDIKPENIFISDSGDFKLGDFGIARTIEKTSSGLSKKGTYYYMAPEIYRGERYGSTIDIYSLGIVLYRLLNANRLPFMPPYPTPFTYQESENALMKRISGAQIPNPKNAEGRLAEIVLKACTYNNSERYSSPMQMRDELSAILYSQSEGEVIYPGGDEILLKSDNSGGTIALPFGTEVISDEKEPPELALDNTSQKRSGGTAVLPVGAGTIGEEKEVPEIALEDTSQNHRGGTVVLPFGDGTLTEEIEQPELAPDDAWRKHSGGTVVLPVGTRTISEENASAETKIDNTSQDRVPEEAVKTETDFREEKPIEAMSSLAGTGNDESIEKPKNKNRLPMIMASVVILAVIIITIVVLIKPNTSSDGAGNVLVVEPEDKADMLPTITDTEKTQKEVNSEKTDAYGISWDKVNGAGLKKGRFQQESLSGKSVTLIYELEHSFTDTQQPSVEDIEHNISVFRNRMDIIGNPYMIGRVSSDVKKIAIKTSPEMLSEEIIKIMGGSGYLTVEGYDGTDIFYTYPSLTTMYIQLNQEQTYEMKFDFDFEVPDNSKQYIEEQTRKWLDENNGITVVRLLIGMGTADYSTAIGKKAITNVVTDATLDFSTWDLGTQTGALELRKKIIVEMLQEILNGEEFVLTYESSPTECTMDLIDTIWDDGHGNDNPSEHIWGISDDEKPTENEIKLDKLMDASVTKAWRVEGYEAAEPYKEYERLFVGETASEYTRYTGKVKPAETQPQQQTPAPANRQSTPQPEPTQNKTESNNTTEEDTKNTQNDSIFNEIGVYDLDPNTTLPSGWGD